MAGMRMGGVILKSLQKKATKLVSVAESLTILFDQEETRLTRKAEVTRLKLLHSTILQWAEQEKGTEISASINHKQVKLTGLMIGIGIRIAAPSTNKKMLAAGNSVLKKFTSEKRTFNTVLIRIVTKGLPDGVDVVCISRLAQESNQSEAEVINQLKKDGCLLLSEESFSRLIDKLAEEILKGRLTLPVNVQILSQILTPHPLRFIHQNKG